MKTLLLILMSLPLVANAQCFFSNLNINIGPCQVGNFYQLTAVAQFSNAPATGNLVLEVNDGVNITDTIIPGPFTSPTNMTLSFLHATGYNCTVTAYFSDQPGCNISLNYTAPLACDCTVDVGTFTSQINGYSIIPTVLTWGDELSLLSNYDNVLHDSVPGIPYAPGLAYLVYTCPPSLGSLPTGDPCLAGFVSFSYDYYDINNGASIYNSFPPQNITNNTIYYVPITMYDTLNGVYATSYNGGQWCYDYGDVFPVTYLDSIGVTTTPNPVNGTCAFNIFGAYPALNGSNFTISEILPITANPDMTTVANNGTFQLSGLQNGQNYSFKISDDAGSVKYVNNYYVGIKEQKTEKIAVSPNPFSEQITVSNISEPTKITLHDATGRIVGTYQTSQNLQVDSSKLSRGVYLLSVQSSNGRQTMRLVKD